MSGKKFLKMFGSESITQVWKSVKILLPGFVEILAISKVLSRIYSSMWGFYGNIGKLKHFHSENHCD